MFGGEETGLSLLLATISRARAPARMRGQPPRPRHARRSQHAVDQQRGEQRMSEYNPRTDTGIPTEPVGSLPRPTTLQAAYADYDAGKIAMEDLAKEQDASAKDSIERF